MNDMLLLIVLILAVSIGWWLGRQSTKVVLAQPQYFSNEYFKGLNFLLDEQPDAAIDAFFHILEVNKDTVNAHLAMGRLFRKRGDVEKATNLHRELLARAELNKDQLLLVKYELANDYMAAGLLDRAERILIELQGTNGDIKWRSLYVLMGLYQQENDWDNAILIAKQLAGNNHPNIKAILAHYCCEKAHVFIESGELNLARKELKDALNYDVSCVRASLLNSSMEYNAGNYKEAIKAFRKVRQQDVVFLTKVIPSLASCYQQLDKMKEFRRFIRDCLQESPSVDLALAAADYLYSSDDDLVDKELFLKEWLQQMPSLSGLAYLIDLQMQHVGPLDKKALSSMYNIIKYLVESQDIYKCDNCGYSGKKLAWLCPSCREWGRFKPINNHIDMPI